ncbi:MAG: hypothetical protein SFT90_06105, partial [Rickettsiales bacterium]|nr:hypothetical protein [Rickettsiales bacterium]
MKKISKKTFLLTSCLIAGFGVYAFAQPASMRQGYKAMEVYVPLNEASNFINSTPKIEGGIINKEIYDEVNKIKINAENNSNYNLAPTMPVEAIKIIRSETPKSESKRKYFLEEKQVPLSPSSPIPPSMRDKSSSYSIENKPTQIEVKINDEKLLENKTQVNTIKTNWVVPEGENIDNKIEIETNPIEVKKKIINQDINKKSNLDSSSINFSDEVFLSKSIFSKI